MQAPVSEVLAVLKLEHPELVADVTRRVMEANHLIATTVQDALGQEEDDAASADPEGT